MRVVIADDALLIREGLARILTAAGIDVIEEVGDVPGLLHAVSLHRPDVAIVDIRMPPGYRDEGLTAAAEIQTRHPKVGVLILSQYVEPAYASALLESSGSRRGYLLKERVLHRDELLSALYRIAAGETVVDRAIVDAAFDAPSSGARLSVLSVREVEVLRLMAQGLTDRGICEKLFLSPKTVATHIQHIFAKLELPDSAGDNRRVHAVLAYLQAF
jgi:DNA-binding NarL/FixJ family response regulator